MLEQERAKYALECIEGMMDRSDEEKGKYLTLVRRLPSMILTNGLGKAVAFLCSLFKETHDTKAAKNLHDHIAEWLIRRQLYQGPKTNLLSALVNSKRDTYLQAEEESLALLTWLTRLADAFIEVPKKR